ncbi:MAG: acetyl-CoA carboxylase biotin carboxylase subunit, partial [Azospirillaceae bacterium]
PDDLAAALQRTRAEARAAFGDDSVYLEKYLDRPRHIEIQVIADSHGTSLHLGERDCSLQRRHQKVLEESPSPALNASERARIGGVVRDAIAELGYLGVGTVEFLYENGEFFFIEMNTRLQVEHPVTEMVTGLDLVREQLRIATGDSLGLRQEDVRITGHAIECRINAEDPQTFRPTPGLVSSYHQPGGPGVRVDSALYSGYRVPPNYDSLIAKLIVHGQSRNECLMRLKRALEEFVIHDLKNTIPLHQLLLESQDFIDGAYDIHWLEAFMADRDA